MDILNVTNEVAQWFCAFGLAAISGLTFHFAWESFTSDILSHISKMTIRIVAAMLAAGLIIWGILRGLQIAFAASLNQTRWEISSPPSHPEFHVFRLHYSGHAGDRRPSHPLRHPPAPDMVGVEDGKEAI